MSDGQWIALAIFSGLAVLSSGISSLASAIKNAVTDLHVRELIEGIRLHGIEIRPVKVEVIERKQAK
jgi:hypothetical protein